MRCEKCSETLDPSAAFCAKCGTKNRRAEAPPPAAPVSNRLLLIVCSLALVAALALIAWMMLSRVRPGDQIVRASGARQQPPSLVQAAPPPAQQPVQAPEAPPAPAGPPREVVAYLALIKRVELAKRQLIHDEKADMSALQTRLPVDQMSRYLNFDQDPSEAPQERDAARERVSNVQQRATAIARQWDQLAAQINSTPAPESCRALRDKYLLQIGKVEAQVLQIYNILSQVESNPQAALAQAEQMKGTASEQVDNAMRDADSALKEVCDRFSLPKDFEVSEGATGSLLRL